MQLAPDFWNLLDWLAFAMTLIGVWQLSSHKKSGFVISGFSSFVWAAVGFHSELIGLSVLNIMLIFIYLRGYLKK